MPMKVSNNPMKQNNSRATCWCIILALIVLFNLMVTNTAYAEQFTIDELVSENRLQANLYLESNSPVYVNQQAVIVVDVLSELPFKGNIAIPYLKLNNAVLIQPNEQAELLTKTINEEIWFVQRKKILIYPLIQGSYPLDPFDVTLSLLGENQQPLAGKLTLDNIDFESIFPKGIKQGSPYIASPDLKFELTVSPKPNKDTAPANFNIGDALTLTYTIRAERNHALVLPKITLPEINGVQIYRKPAVEKNDFDRFDKINTAIITQEFTLIFQEQGLVTLPKQQINWWNTETQQFSTLAVAKKQFQIGSNNTQLTEKVNPVTTALNFDAQKLTSLFYVLLLGIGLLLLTRLLIKKWPQLIVLFQKWNNTKYKQLEKQFISQVSRQEYIESVQTLYNLDRLLKHTHLIPCVELNEKACVLREKLNQAAFSTHQDAVFTKADGINLLKDLKSESPKRHTLNQETHLNP